MSDTTETFELLREMRKEMRTLSDSSHQQELVTTDMKGRVERLEHDVGLLWEKKVSTNTFEPVAISVRDAKKMIWGIICTIVGGIVLYWATGGFG